MFKIKEIINRKKKKFEKKKINHIQEEKFKSKEKKNLFEKHDFGICRRVQQIHEENLKQTIDGN